VEILSPKAIVDSFKAELGNNLVSSEIYEREIAVKKNLFRRIWIQVDRDAFRQAVLHLCKIQEHPHLAIIAPSDLGDEVELVYLFTIYYGIQLQEITLGIKVRLAKSDLKIASITDIIPGAILTDRETQEMMGVEVVGIPDNRRLFLAEIVPEGVYPWRKDDTGPQDLLRVLPGREPIK